MSGKSHNAVAIISVLAAVVSFFGGAGSLLWWGAFNGPDWTLFVGIAGLPWTVLFMAIGNALDNGEAP